MAQKPVMRGEVGCACVAREVSVERGGMGVTPPGLSETFQERHRLRRGLFVPAIHRPRDEKSRYFTFNYKTELCFWRGQVKYGLPTERHQTNRNFEARSILKSTAFALRAAGIVGVVYVMRLTARLKSLRGSLGSPQHHLHVGPEAVPPRAAKYTAAGCYPT